MRYSKDPRIDGKVRELVRNGWTISNGGARPKLTSPAGSRISIITTPSDHRSALNWLSRLKKIESST